ncbi:hypothetical protein GNX71_29175 [Variovorax sp. RKNM96]|uniref:hypothetical protein n=1 Tax=Variovorax sp. RKNM96 TaxID=2681552 RepID=UPI00197FE4B1|nr:hypothetical protein [Variovorax sp. RKNM96]QSI33420.1 hypothetical protein GNX71_29175 [Variovorax sp. RKNM96]
MSGVQAEIRSGLAERTAAGDALFFGFWLVLFLGCGLVALAIKDSEQSDHELELQRVHTSGMDAGYKLCKSEGR